ncbi:PrpF domain-containing protein [Micrococcus lylae]|uniref:PrpF domain-containing protein n=1 Tax=Micrococcus lylae TaxID=1273 RepID=UPI0015D77D44|nr:PrpF domain-containing protein [Micrococcus lylae]
MIVEPSSRDGIDIDYTFAQVGITEAKVDWGSNCGNCSSTVGLHAIEAGWVEPTSDVTTVVVLNTNTDQVIVQRVDTPGGKLPERPDAIQTGVPFPGHRVALGFEDPAGKSTGALFPTGNVSDEFLVNGRHYRASLVDAGAPCVFLAAADLHLEDVPHHEWSTRMGSQLQVMEQIRREAAVLMQIVGTADAAERAIPKIGVVGQGSTDGNDAQVVMLSMGVPHPAMPITGSVALTYALCTPGTVIHKESANQQSIIKIHTPAGLIETSIEEANGVMVVAVTRTARLLADSTLSLPGDLLQKDGYNESYSPTTSEVQPA